MFCRHLSNGLVYNNNTVNFTVSPCCYYRNHSTLDPEQNLSQQLSARRINWLESDVRKNCKICIDAEEQGLTSYRQSSFDIIQGGDSCLEFLTVAVNKTCNLACASCNASSSSYWYQENTRHKVVQTPLVHSMHRQDRNGDTTDRFVELLCEQDLSRLRYIKFGGGEPLMSDTHERIMALIPNPSEVTVQYTSNFSIMPSPHTMKMWDSFKLIKWIASIDGVGEQFSFLRWPYRWEKLEAFIKTAKAEVPGNVCFGVEHTVNPLNVYFFGQFSDWFDEHLATNRYGDQSDFNLHNCNGVLGLEHTPPTLRAKVTQTYGSDHPISIALKQKAFSGTVAPMVKYLDQLDAWRGTQWRSIFAEVQECFSA